MVRFRNALAAAAIMAGGIVFAAQTAAEAPAPIVVTFPHKVKIVAFGSSSTQGVGASRQALAYPEQLEAQLRMAMTRGTQVEVVNRGIGGEDADDMAVRLQVDVIARQPDLVVWQTGSNDSMRHVPLERFERETREGILAMRAAGIQVLLMEPQWSPYLEKDADAGRYREAVRRVGAAMNVKVIRRFDLMHEWVRRGLATKAELLSADGLHMSDRGYALLARWVASEVLAMQACRSVAPADSVAAL